MKILTTVNKKMINYIIIFLVLCLVILFFISQIKIEKSFEAFMNIDEEKAITLIIDSSDAYFIKDEKTINFILNNKLYIVDNVLLIPLPNNKFSIKINDKNLEMLLQPNTALKVNINLGFQKLYELLLRH